MDLSRYLPQLIEGNSGETSRNSIMNIDFIAGEFSSFCQILHIHIPRLAYFFDNNFPIFFNLKKNRHNFFQYESVHRILYFHIFHIRKFG